MGVVEDILGGMMGGGDPGASRMQGVLMSLLGAGNAAGAMGGQGPQPDAGVSGAGGSGSGGFGAGLLGGGLGGLVELFERNGLGPIIQSWIGNGANQPVSPEQLSGALGGERVAALAQQAGMQQGDFLAQLAQHLPGLVDGMTPGGHLPGA